MPVSIPLLQNQTNTMASQRHPWGKMWSVSEHFTPLLQLQMESEEHQEKMKHGTSIQSIPCTHYILRPICCWFFKILLAAITPQWILVHWASVTSYYPCCYNWAWGHNWYSSSNYFQYLFWISLTHPSTSVPLDCFLGSVPVTSSLGDLSPFPLFLIGLPLLQLTVYQYHLAWRYYRHPVNSLCSRQSLCSHLNPTTQDNLFNYTPPSTSINSFLCLRSLAWGTQSFVASSLMKLSLFLSMEVVFSLGIRTCNPVKHKDMGPGSTHSGKPLWMMVRGTSYFIPWCLELFILTGGHITMVCLCFVGQCPESTEIFDLS